ncbi:MAG: hypothetical protein AB7J28_12305 [Hyphomonadaceae bacterium]
MAGERRQGQPTNWLAGICAYVGAAYGFYLVNLFQIEGLWALSVVGVMFVVGAWIGFVLTGILAFLIAVALAIATFFLRREIFSAIGALFSGG